MTNEKLIISGKVEKLKSEKGNPLLFLPPFRGEIERGDLSTCQLFNPSSPLQKGWMPERPPIQVKKK